MRKSLALAALLVALASTPLYARERLQGDCEQGGNTVTTSGLTSTTKVQRSYPSCTITVFDKGTVNLSTIYDDNAGTLKGNPFQADTDGHWYFYADNARYDVRESAGGIASPFTRGDYTLNDPAETTLSFLSVAFAASETFDASQASGFAVTLTGNVTSSSVTNPKTGRLLILLLCQDAVGGRTFAWPASFDSPPVIGTAASRCTNTTWYYNGTKWKQTGASGDLLALPANSVIYNGTAILTLPTTTDSLVGRVTTDTLQNKTISGGTFTGSIAAAGMTLTGGTFSAITLTGAIPAGGATVTGGTFSSPTISSPTLSGTLAGGPLTASGVWTFNEQVTVSKATGTAPFAITSTTPVANLTPMRLNSVTTINTVNAITLTFAEPAAIRSHGFPDPGGDWQVLLTPTAENVDCTDGGLTCTRTEKDQLRIGGCPAGVASMVWSTPASNGATANCVVGTNTIRPVLEFCGIACLRQTKQNDNGAGAGTVTTTYSAAAASTLIAVVYLNGNFTVSGCTDGTNVYALRKRQQNGVTLNVEIWDKLNATAVNGVTLTCTASGATIAALEFFEYTGLTAAANDQTQGGTGVGTAVSTTATAATAQADELIFSAVAATANPTITGGSGWNRHTGRTVGATIAGNSQGKLVHAVATFTGDMTLGSAQTWAAAIATYKANTATDTSAQIVAKRFSSDAVVSASLTVPYTATWTPNSQGARMTFATSCYATAESTDQVFNASTANTVTVPTTANQAVSADFSALDVTNCNANEWLLLKATRNTANAADTFEGPLQMDVSELTTKRAE